MNMIIIHPNLYKRYLISLGYLKAYVSQSLINFFSKYYLTIFRWKYRMVQNHRYIMALMYIFTHIRYMTYSSLRTKLRGIKP